MESEVFRECVKCFLCGSLMVKPSFPAVPAACEMDETKESKSTEIKQFTDAPNPLHILLDSVLRISTDWNDTNANLTLDETFHFCSKCSECLIEFHKIGNEMKRLELLAKSLTEGFINSTIKSLVDLSTEHKEVKVSELLLEDAIRHLKRVPIQFKIYKKWRARFMKTFKSLQEQNDPPVHISHDELSNRRKEIESEQNTSTLSSTSSLDLSLSNETHVTLVHDHSYGVILLSNQKRSEKEVEDSEADNNKANQCNEILELNSDRERTEGYYKCSGCSRKFRRKATLNEHIKTCHMHDDAYFCSKCNTQYSDQQSFYEHLCLSSCEITFSKCSICSEQFDSCEFDRCEECRSPVLENSKFVFRNKRKRIKRAYGTSKDDDDPYNSKITENKAKITKRVRPRLDKMKISQCLTCEFCDKTYRKRRDLNRHVRSHTGERPYVCEHCLKAFLDSRQLKIHLRIHTGEKPYICELCGSGFSSLAGFHSHRKTHTKLKPYKCEQCQGNFRSAGQLRKHSLIHSGERPFSCTICQKSFNRKENLRIHEYTHSALKPHSCSLCPQSFIRSSNLRNHIMDCHSTEDTEDVTAYLPFITEEPNVDVCEDQVEIVAYEPTISSLPILSTTSININPATVIPEAVFIAESGEQYIIFN